ncbi:MULTISPECIES: hypothetical protein [unclassified Pseudomonas]|uniref:hypothetical protein n=1 Tax=unclassified Pseudomonas TaxID=196821 RepID=UPI00072FC80C|nr:MULTISPECIES: hypothetical protein [unclassified Pseudomonas]KSW22246.1 hypothetical protein AOX63_02095 [Pseudomonas sp. ADP]OBP10309.1 hypothetical protein BAE52_13985 [Pseudomonas sp. EGD-AKN5]QOF85040.1 hypothetical protein IG194_31800 [Pseudomonas sp. ADPe]
MGTPLHHESGLAWSSSVTSVVSDDLEAFLQQLPAQYILLKITYPTALNIAREQQEHLARLLFTQGLKRSALLIESAARYLVFSEPHEAWDTYCCLRYASLAIGVSIYRVGFYRETLTAQRTQALATTYATVSSTPALPVDDTRSLV